MLHYLCGRKILYGLYGSIWFHINPFCINILLYFFISMFLLFPFFTRSKIGKSKRKRKTLVQNETNKRRVFYIYLIRRLYDIYHEKHYQCTKSIGHNT